MIACSVYEQQTQRILKKNVQKPFKKCDRLRLDSKRMQFATIRHESPKCIISKDSTRNEEDQLQIYKIKRRWYKYSNKDGISYSLSLQEQFSNWSRPFSHSKEEPNKTKPDRRTQSLYFIQLNVDLISYYIYPFCVRKWIVRVRLLLFVPHVAGWIHLFLVLLEVFLYIFSYSFGIFIFFSFW